ncbi:MAG: two-component system response regulator [Leptolyngbyaceae cyanobacterium]
MPTHDSFRKPSIESFYPQKPTVVNVDDDSDSLLLVSYVLEAFSCSSLCETEGESALKLISRLIPDLILVDIRLPKLSGLDIIRTLKANQPTSKIPAIAITAVPGAEYRREIFRAGFDHYLCKPYHLDDLYAAIGCYLPVKSIA